MKLLFGIVVPCVALVACEAIDPNPGPEQVGAPEGGYSDPSIAGQTGEGDAGVAPPDEPPDRVDEDAGAAAVDPELARLRSDGEALYFRYCAVCHGNDASGAGPSPDSIQGATEIAEVVWEGQDEMPAFPQLTEEDIAAIEAFLASFESDMPPEAPMAPVWETPQDVYAAECGICHGEQGVGGERGPSIQRPVVGYAIWVTRNGRATRHYPLDMPEYAVERVSDDQLAEVLGWLGEVPKPADGEGLWRMFCANCHGEDGRGRSPVEGVRGKPMREYTQLVRRGHGGTRYSSARSYMPSWSTAEISDVELQLMYRYISGL